VGPELSEYLVSHLAELNSCNSGANQLGSFQANWLPYLKSVRFDESGKLASGSAAVAFRQTAIMCHSINTSAVAFKCKSIMLSTALRWPKTKQRQQTQRNGFLYMCNAYMCHTSQGQFLARIGWANKTANSSFRSLISFFIESTINQSSMLSMAGV